MDQGKALLIAQQYKKLLTGVLAMEAMYLFGSYAVNKQSDSSDIDIAIVVEELPEDYFDIVPKLWKLRRQLDTRIEPIIIEKLHDDSRFLDEVQKHGIWID